jgi:site-specific DNA-methyltransferase (adenine-specific)
MSLDQYLNKITCGDCYELIKNLPDKSIDLIVTDPPYQIDKTQAGNKSELALSIQKMNDELEEYELTNSINPEILDEFMRVMKVPNIYIWCNIKQIPLYINYFVNENDCKLDIIIWAKTNATPLFNNKYMSDKEYCLYFRKGGYCNPQTYEEAKTFYYQPINISDKNMFHHTTIKPSNIITNLIKNSSQEGDIILDTFCGSGTVPCVCKELNRNFVAFEINPKWCKIANDRLENIDANGQMSFFAK